jgi:hypothetical protein
MSSIKRRIRSATRSPMTREPKPGADAGLKLRPPSRPLDSKSSARNATTVAGKIRIDWSGIFIRHCEFPHAVDLFPAREGSLLLRRGRTVSSGPDGDVRTGHDHQCRRNQQHDEPRIMLLNAGQRDQAERRTN